MSQVTVTVFEKAQMVERFETKVRMLAALERRVAEASPTKKPMLVGKCGTFMKALRESMEQEAA